MELARVSDKVTQDLFVSIVIRIRNHARLLHHFIEEVESILSALYSDYEIILVDDGSSDLADPLLDSLLSRYDCIRCLRLSRSFGREVSIYAGMQAAIGDYIVILSIETDPPSLIPELVNRVMHHKGVVYGVCTNRLDESPAFKVVKSAFTWFAVTVLNLPLAKDATQFMVFSRQALNALLEIKDHYRHVRLFTAYIGYPQEYLEYEQVSRGQHVSRRPILRGVAVGISMIFANSSRPLRWTSWLVMLGSLLNLLYRLQLLPTRLLENQDLGNSASASPEIAVMFFLISLLLTIMSEYLSCIIEGSHQRPLYYVREEKNSSVVIKHVDRLNVTAQSR